MIPSKRKQINSQNRVTILQLVTNRKQKRIKGRLTSKILIYLVIYNIFDHGFIEQKDHDTKTTHCEMLEFMNSLHGVKSEITYLSVAYMLNLTAFRVSPTPV